MGARVKVFCGLVIFLIVFGLRFFCANCQRFPPQQQHIPLQHHQLQTLTIPIQKDLLPNENRLQSQVRLCSNGPLVFPCPKRFRNPFFLMFPVAVPPTVKTTTSVPQVFIRSGATLVVQDPVASSVGQKEYYSDWSHTVNSKTEQQETTQSKPQRRPGKNCKRKRRPISEVSSTESTPSKPQEQFWRGHVEDEYPRGQFKPQRSDVKPTQISERAREPSTTKFSERIGEAQSSVSDALILEPSPTQVVEKNRTGSSLKNREGIRKSLPTIYSEKIREFNPTKESLIARQPITSTVFDKIQEPSPTRISERNIETFSTKNSEKTPQDVAPAKNSERIREPAARKSAEKFRDTSARGNKERIREPLAALEKEQKLFEQRDRQRQEFVPEINTGHRDKSYRRPYSQAKKENNPQMNPRKEEPAIKSSSARSPIDLKEILKNSGGLSLSEILQQKNLSLDDLLKGKQNALLALQTTATAPQKSEDNNSRERFPKPVRRLPPMSSTTETAPISTSETTTVANRSVGSEESQEHPLESQEHPFVEVHSEEIEDSQEFKNVSTIRKNLKFPSRIRTKSTTRRQQHETAVTQQKFSTTTTTPKPSTTRVPHYKKRQPIRSSLMRAPSLIKQDSTSVSESKESQESSISKEDSPYYPKRNRYRPTSTTTTESITDLIDPASNIVEDSGENEILIKATSLENASFVNENKSTPAMNDQEVTESKNYEEPTTDHIYRYNSLKNYIDNNLPHAVFMDIDLADIDPVDDRTDLLELIEDRRSGNRLIKVLEQRNMTLEELIEHRKRGSSQLHLATFVQNRSGVFPGKKVVVNDDMDIVTAFENFPHFNLLNLKSVKPDEIKTDSQGSSYFTSIIDIEPTDEVFKDGSGSGATPSRKNSISSRSSSNIQRQPFYPSWKSLALASLTTGENARRFLQQSDPQTPQQTAQKHQSTDVDDESILQIEDEVARAHDLVDLELSGHGFKRSAINLMHTSQVPPGIRSAIVASAAIVLTSLVTFMVIFAACRWKQRRRRHKLDYMEAYNALKNTLPVISSRKIDEPATSTTSLGSEDVPSRVSRSNSRQADRHQLSIVFPGATGGFPSSRRSLSSPGSKLNTMDPNSPEVRDYLFDALRESF